MEGSEVPVFLQWQQLEVSLDAPLASAMAEERHRGQVSQCFSPLTMALLLIHLRPVGSTQLAGTEVEKGPNLAVNL